MKKSRDVRKLIGVLLAVTLLLGVAGFTYAYFGLEIEGKPKDIVMETGDLKLTYIDDTELKLTDAMPGDTITKKIKVYNGGNKKVSYNFYWGDLVNTIDFFELHVIMECKSYKNYGTTSQTESGTCDRIYRAVPISDTVTDGNIKKNISIDAGITQEYTVTVQFDNKNYPQDDNLNKSFTGKIGIEAYEELKEIYCTYDGELTPDATYTKDGFTYKYKKERKDYWNSIDVDGWGVIYDDKSSTEPITEAPCTYINDKPIVSMSEMFNGSKATYIDVSNYNTKNVINMYRMFDWVESAEIVGLENFDTSNVTNMGEMFYRVSTAKLDVSSFDTSNVTNMYGMFAYNSYNLDLTNFNTGNVTDMSYMFYDLSSNVIDVSGFDTSNVIKMSGMFNGADAIKKIDLSNFNTSKVTTMQYMFESFNTSSLNLENFDTSKVVNMNRMFYYSNIPYLNLNGFNTRNVTDMEGMFALTKTTELEGLNNFNTSSVTDMSRMFYSSQIKLLDLRSFDTSNVTNMLDMFRDSKAVQIFGLNTFNTDKVTNMRYMFYGTSNLQQELDLSSFNTSKVTNMSYMFGGSSTTRIKGLDKFNTTKVTDMSGMFSNTSKLQQELNLFSFNTSKVTNMSSIFGGCQATSLNLNSFDTSNVTDMSGMFGDTSKLTSIDVSGFDTSNVTDMSSMFYKTKLREIKGLEKFNTSKVTSMLWMFQESKFIEILDLSSWDTSNVTTMYQMFLECRKLKTIYASDKFVTTNVTNSRNMFSSTESLIGGAGTVWSSSNPIDNTYARIDGGTSSPGYFTLKNIN